MDYQTPLFYRVMQYADNVDRDVIGMVSGNPDWAPPPALREGLADYAEAPSTEFQYPPSAGLESLREAVADDRGINPDRIILTNGAGEANYLALATALETTTVDTPEVLLSDPVYPYYPGKTKLLGATPRYVALDDDGSIDPVAVEETITDRTAAIMVTTPHNPTGAVYDRATLRALADIAAEHNALLISDEVYHRFDYSGRFASARKAAADPSSVIVTDSFSKSMAITGFRVGYVVLPDPLYEQARTRHMLVNVTGSRPAQTAVKQALLATDPDYYRQHRDLMAQRVKTFIDRLTAAGLECYEPDGGFYARVKLPDGEGTLAEAKRLIEESGVAGMPGQTFGDDHDWLRFSLTTDRIGTAADRIAAYAQH